MAERSGFIKRSALTGLVLIGLAGCAGESSRVSPEPETLGIPESWQGRSTISAPVASSLDESSDQSLYSPLLAVTPYTRWIKSFNDPGLTLLVERVLAHNPQLAAEAAKVQSAGAGQIQSSSALYPTLDLTGSITERESGGIRSDSQTVSLNAGFELDLWGRLTAREREASLRYAKARVDFTHLALGLSADTAVAWYTLITEKKLLELYQRREDTLANALKVVEQGYSRGVKEIADLLQARDNLKNEQENIASQQQRVQEQVRGLQVLLGRYPDGRLLSEDALNLPELPVLELDLLPSELISRSPELQSLWLELLAADAALAAANRDRFPSLSLTASVDQNVDWNLMARLTQPLFNAGKLAAAEAQAAAFVQQKEKLYLQSLFATFANTENALMQETTLAERYRLEQDNFESSRQTTALILSEYQLGLTELEPLLSAQRAMLDAEANLIRLRNEQLTNRIRLFQLMGGAAEQQTLPLPSEAL